MSSLDVYIMCFLGHLVIHLDALSLIVHHCKQFRKEINKICSYFYGIPVVWCFFIVSSFVISFLHDLCMPSSILLLLTE